MGSLQARAADSFILINGSLELHLHHQASNLQWRFGDRFSNPSLDLHNLFVRDSRF